MQEKSAADYAGLAATVQEAINCAVACGDDATARELSAILADIMAAATAVDTPSPDAGKRTDLRGH